MTIDELQEPSRRMAELWFIGDLISKELNDALDVMESDVRTWSPKPMPANYNGTHKDWTLQREDSNG